MTAPDPLPLGFAAAALISTRFLVALRGAALGPRNAESLALLEEYIVDVERVISCLERGDADGLRGLGEVTGFMRYNGCNRLITERSESRTLDAACNGFLGAVVPLIKSR